MVNTPQTNDGAQGDELAVFALYKHIMFKRKWYFSSQL